MNLKSTITVVFLTLSSLSSVGQTSTLIVPNKIVLPSDTVVKRQLIESLNGFLAETTKPNKENTFVLKSGLLETSVLIDEIKDLGKSNQLKNDNFYKPYLTNSTQLNDSSFLIQLSYIGINENLSVLRASFTFFANKEGNRFYFNSPLKQHTISWKKQKINNTNIYYKNAFNDLNANTYFKMVDDYDKKLNAPKLPTDFYCADNFLE